MSDTIVDMAKVTQMLDAGWTVQLRKVGGSYIAVGTHDNPEVWERAKGRLHDFLIRAGWDAATAFEINDFDLDKEGQIETDDFTPEQALTRLAYKVHGEII